MLQLDNKPKVVTGWWSLNPKSGAIVESYSDIGTTNNDAIMQEDPLFVMIQRMSKSEKRYFKLFSNLQIGREGQNYLKLFDFLASESCYNHERLLAHFPDPGFQKRISSEKDYLYRQILRAMRQYRQKSSPSVEIQNLIQDGSFLYEKAMYKASAARFRKASKLADKMEDRLAQLEILVWQSRLAHLSKEEEILMKTRLAVGEGHLKSLQDHFQLLARYNELSELVRAYHDLRHEDHRKELNRILSDPLLTTGSPPGDFEAAHLYHQIIGLAKMVTGDLEAAVVAYKELVAHWERSSHKIKASPTRYKQVLSLLGQRLSQQGETNEAQVYLEQIRSIKEASVHDRFQVRQILLFEEMLLFLNKKDLGALKSVLPEAEKWLGQFASLLQAPRRISFYANVSLSHFLLSDFKISLEYLNLILNEHRGTIRIDVQYFARILELLLHYELGNASLLEYAIRSTTRFLKRREALHDFEKTFLLHFQTVFQLSETKGQQEAFQAMALEIQLKIPPDKLNQIPGGTVLLIWLLSKVNGRSIGDQFLLYNASL